jgi:hypothetical protein
MKTLIVYTFNYYLDRPEEFMMLKLSLYSVYHELVNNTLFDVIIYTETHEYLSKELDFPCLIVQMDQKDYMYGGYDYPDTKYLFITHVRMLVLYKLLTNGQYDKYDKYDKYVYLDNDTIVLRGHYDDILDGLNHTSYFGYDKQDIKINNYLNFKGATDKYWQYLDSAIIGNGIIVLDSIAVDFVSTVIEVHTNLIDRYGWLPEHDKIAFSIAYHMNYDIGYHSIFDQEGMPLISYNSKLKYLYHYCREKNRYPKVIIDQLNRITKFPLNNKIQYDYLLESRTLFDNVIYHSGSFIPKIIHIVLQSRDDVVSNAYSSEWILMIWYIDEINDKFVNDTFRRNYNHAASMVNRMFIYGCNVLYEHGGVLIKNDIKYLPFDTVIESKFIAITDDNNNVINDFIASGINNDHVLQYIKIDWDCLHLKNKFLKYRMAYDVKIYPSTRYIQ